MKTQTLTKKLKEFAVGVRDEATFTGMHFSALYTCFKKLGVAGVVLAPLYDPGITLTINGDEGTRMDGLREIYGGKTK